MTTLDEKVTLEINVCPAVHVCVDDIKAAVETLRVEGNVWNTPVDKDTSPLLPLVTVDQ